MNRIFLITDNGYEHKEILAAVVAPAGTIMNNYLWEFEDLMGCHPSTELIHYKEGKALDNHLLFIANLKARLIHANLLPDYEDEYYRDKCSMSDFLLAFANWLEREKNFTLLPVEEVGYVNCGLKP